eukprot:Clim_evm11s143 gene=Clim_evmTU11s143
MRFSLRFGAQQTRIDLPNGFPLEMLESSALRTFQEIAHCRLEQKHLMFFTEKDHKKFGTVLVQLRNGSGVKQGSTVHCVLGTLDMVESMGEDAAGAIDTSESVANARRSRTSGQTYINLDKLEGASPEACAALIRVDVQGMIVPCGVCGETLGTSMSGMRGASAAQRHAVTCKDCTKFYHEQCAAQSRCAARQHHNEEGGHGTAAGGANAMNISASLRSTGASGGMHRSHPAYQSMHQSLVLGGTLGGKSGTARSTKGSDVDLMDSMMMSINEAYASYQANAMPVDDDGIGSDLQSFNTERQSLVVNRGLVIDHDGHLYAPLQIDNPKAWPNLICSQCNQQASAHSQSDPKTLMVCVCCNELVHLDESCMHRRPACAVATPMNGTGALAEGWVEQTVVSHGGSAKDRKRRYWQVYPGAILVFSDQPQPPPEGASLVAQLRPHVIPLDRVESINPLTAAPKCRFSLSNAVNEVQAAPEIAMGNYVEPQEFLNGWVTALQTAKDSVRKADTNTPARTVTPGLQKLIHGSLRGSPNNKSHRITLRGGTECKGPGNVEWDRDVAVTSRWIYDDYDVLEDEVLGSGQFGLVMRALEKTTSMEFAVKVIARGRISNENVANYMKEERAILQAVTHPAIIKLHAMYETPESIFMVMDMVYGKDMLERIMNAKEGHLSDRITRHLLVQILVGIQYLHSNDIVHRDLKPENVLLTTEAYLPQAKICDFGFAKVVGGDSFLKSVVGTPAYVAPEIRMGNSSYERGVDLWSLGVIAYVSLSGVFPFNENENVVQQVSNPSWLFPKDIWGNRDRDSISFITGLLMVNSEERLNVEQALKHPYLRDEQLKTDIYGMERRAGCGPYISSWLN